MLKLLSPRSAHIFEKSSSSSVLFSRPLQVHNILDIPFWGQIGRQATELAALEN